MYYCIAEFEAKQDRELELFEALKGLEKETRVEKGCVQYKVMRKIKNEFAQGDSKGIIMNEIWETVEDFNVHNQSKHVQDFFKKECLSYSGSAESWNVNLFK